MDLENKIRGALTRVETVSVKVRETIDDYVSRNFAEVFRAASDKVNSRLSEVRSGLDSLLGFASEYYFPSSIVLAAFGFIVGYAGMELFKMYLGQSWGIRSSIMRELSGLFSTPIGILFAFYFGITSLTYLHEENHLRDLGLTGGTLKSKTTSSLVSFEKGWPLKTWDWCLEHPALFALPPGFFLSYVTSVFTSELAGLELPLFVKAIYYLCAYTGLKFSGGYLHSDSLRSRDAEFTAKLKARTTKNPFAYAAEMEKMVSKAPFSRVRVILMDEYYRLGLIDEAMSQGTALVEQGIVLPRCEHVGLFSHPFKEIVADKSENIMSKNPKIASYITLAAILSIFDVDRAEDIIHDMVYTFDTPESRLLAFRFFHKAGNREKMTRYLKEAVSAVYKSPELYRRASLGDTEPSSDIFSFEKEYLRRFVVKSGRNTKSLEFEFFLTELVRAVLQTTPYSSPEPLYAGPLNGVSAYVMSYVAGNTLYHDLMSGNAGLDDLLAAWDLTRIIHDKIDPSISIQDYKPLGYVPPDKKLQSVLSREYLGLSEDLKSDLMTCADLIKDYLGGFRRVINTDGHPENRVKHGNSVGIVDLEDKGVVEEILELANLLSWRRVPSVAGNERLFLGSNDHIVPYWHAVLLKSLSLYSAWMSPDKSSMNPFAPEKIQDAMDAIQMIKNEAPISFAHHIAAYNKTMEGLQTLKMHRLAA